LCAAVVEVSGDFWRKIWPFGSKTILCKTCHRYIAIRDAKVMGESFSHWSRQFQATLADTVRELPVLPSGDALTALAPNLRLDDARTVASLQSLLQFTCAHYRQVVKECAQGRQAELEIVVCADRSAKPRCAGILGRRSAESGGAGGGEVFIARVADEQYLLYVPTHPTGRITEAKRVRSTSGGSAIMVTPIAAQFGQHATGHPIAARPQ
jgi:hypothetical protein